MLKFIFAIAWICCGLGAAGAFNAEFRGEHPRLAQSPSWAAHTLGEGVLWGMMGGPLSLIAAAGFTGGFYHGWTLARESLPCRDANPDDWCKP